MTTTTIRHLPAPDISWTREADVVVVGAGAAGLSAALEASARGRRVLLIGKAGLDAGSSPLAQGGLAAVLGPADSPGLHHQDTVTAGAGLCDDAAVAALVSAAPGEIAWLTALGARFDPGPLGLEGGHSRPRIVHAGGDASGAEVQRVLRRAVVDAPVEILTDTVALDALLDERGRVAGLLAGTAAGRRTGAGVRPLAAGDLPAGGLSLGALSVGVIRAAAVVLASGGYGQAYATTTNPVGATGDGLALALRAGAEVTDVEFVQFHPTVLWQAAGRGQQPLVTEALRGAGAVLVDVHGRPVMAGRHPLADLAPRDVVAAEMYRRMATGDGPGTHLWLDATAVGRPRLEEHFPTVTAACRALGIEPSREPIPVAPGAHYACGGIRADLSGRTTLAGLYAIGEVAATGVHGANRLASNSLTEAISAGRRLGQALGTTERIPDRSPAGALRPPAAGAGVRPASRAGTASAMSRHASVVRDRAGLEHLLGLLAAVPPAATAPPPAGPPPAGPPLAARPLDLATVEATNLHAVSVLVAVAALARAESRGCHRRSDAPATWPGPAERIGIRSRAGELDARFEDLAETRIGASA
jgi:L-aspartate oxidase